MKKGRQWRLVDKEAASLLLKGANVCLAPVSTSVYGYFEESVFEHLQKV